MGYYNYPAGTATGAEAQLRYNNYSLQYYYWVPMCWVGMIITLITICTSYAFKKQRTFPASVANWTALMDLIKYTRELLKFSPIPILQEWMFYKQGYTVCSFLFVINIINDTGTAIVNLEIAIIIYFCIVKKVDMTYDVDKRWFWGFVIVFWVYMTVISTAMGALTPNYTSIVHNGCPTSNANMYYFLIGQWCVVITLTASLIILSLKYIREVMSNTKKDKANSTQRKKMWIYIRFIMIIFVQTIPHFMDNFNFGYNVDHKNSAVGLGLVNTVTIILPLFYITDCIIIMIGNTQLRKWIKRKWGMLRLKLLLGSPVEAITPSSEEGDQGLSLPHMASLDPISPASTLL